MNTRTVTVFVRSTAISPAVPATSASAALYPPPVVPTTTATINAPRSPYQPMRPTTPEGGPSQAKERRKSSWLGRPFEFFSTPQNRSPNKLRKRRPDKPPGSPLPSPSPSPSMKNEATANQKKKRRSISVWLQDPFHRDSRNANGAVASGPPKETSTATLPGPARKGGPGKRDEVSQTVAAAPSQAPVPKPKPRIMLNDPTKPYLYPTPSTIHTRAQSPDRIPLPEEVRRLSTPQVSRSGLTLHHWMQNSAAVSYSDFIPVLPDIDGSTDHSDWGKPWTSAGEQSTGLSTPLPLFARLQARREPERGDLGQLRRSAARRGQQRSERSGTASQRDSSVDALAGNGPAQNWRRVDYGNAEDGNPQQAFTGFAVGRPSSRFLVNTSGEGPQYYEFPIPRLQPRQKLERDRYSEPQPQPVPYPRPHQRGPAATSARQRAELHARRKASMEKSEALARERENYIPYRPPPVMLKEPVTLADPVSASDWAPREAVHADQSDDPRMGSHGDEEIKSIDEENTQRVAAAETTKVPEAVGDSDAGKARNIDERTGGAKASSSKDFTPRLGRSRSAPAKIALHAGGQSINVQALPDHHLGVLHQAPPQTLLKSSEPVPLAAVWSTPPISASKPEHPELDDPRGIIVRHAREVEDVISNLPEMTEEYRSSSQRIALATAEGRTRKRTSSEYSFTHSSDFSRSSSREDGVDAQEASDNVPPEIEEYGGVVDNTRPLPDVVVVKESSSTKPANGAAGQGQRITHSSLWERRTGTRLTGSPVTQLFDMLRNPYWDHHW
ncbi:hypothetical protein LTR91_024270 [Friedmanniomyces endolithicus]|uniref:Uncharacterized protein n=1 Tax=Friedmanniomyces endolithicus TaxID=329885 RepID=A0AAN6H7A8_9PEZI|nr:hypothetical protein LTR87_006815 [Friedmanniomyces endolithicus]KAK0894902.1 hypothetical protein LTR57_023280 [Friedmanniomyces endolithicus]KAK0952663.1 hypothetical protein LTR91_024270 [Friedmanniomyces endolithicus]KAK0998720.1 hypothetical protein LTS01_005547 [Friedmanniomyces endolithicus]KAK1033373.1 hypothetical protein LTS16_016367 [Friedmanniomyces endolithicus]